MNTKTETTQIREDPAVREDGGGALNTVRDQHVSGLAYFGMDDSWIKIYRKLEYHWIWQDKPEYLKIWVGLLLRTKWTPGRIRQGSGYLDLQRGELAIGLEEFAKYCNVGVGFVRKFLKLAEKDGMIFVKSNKHGTIVKVIKYNDLQSRGNHSEQEPNKNRTRTEQEPNNSIRKKEYKKVRKEEINTDTLYAPSSSELVAGLPQNDGQLFPITKDQHDRWQQLYPAVKIKSELSKIIGWLEANPTKRKTKRGMLSFVNRWLSREQDKGAVNAPQATKYTVGDRQAVIDYKTSHKQLEEERDAVAAYLRNQSQPIRYNEVAVPIIRRLGNGEED